MHFGQLLRGHRLTAGWTQEELAERSGVSAHAISVLESGRRRPRLSSLAALATGLGLGQAERDRLIGAANADVPDATPAGPRIDVPDATPAGPPRDVPDATAAGPRIAPADATPAGPRFDPAGDAWLATVPLGEIEPLLARVRRDFGMHPDMVVVLLLTEP
jgi:DNA-binding XRE family transcriptional regulator